MARTYSAWSEQDRSKALAMVANGVMQKDIAVQLGRSPRAVQQFLANERGYFNKLGRSCLDCSTAIKDANRTGRCRPCNTSAQNRDADFTGKRLTGLRESGTMKPGSPQCLARAAKGTATRMSNPAYVEGLRERMRNVIGPRSHTPEASAKVDYAEVGRKIRERRLGWCPLEYRAEYTFLIRSKCLPMSEARAIIEAQIRAKVAKLSPFERQERALAQGARVVANDKARVNLPTGYDLLDEKAA